MTVISRRLVVARKRHRCEKGSFCSAESEIIQPGEQYVRLFGAAYRTDPPYTVRVHVQCETDDTKPTEPTSVLERGSNSPSRAPEVGAAPEDD